VREQHRYFLLRERRRRFIEHQDARPFVHGAKDFHQLLLPHAQPAHGRVRCNRQAEFLQQGGRAAIHLQPIDAPATPWFAAEKIFSATLNSSMSANS
jgi:hypothetical protein